MPRRKSEGGNCESPMKVLEVLEMLKELKELEVLEIIGKWELGKDDWLTSVKGGNGGSGGRSVHFFRKFIGTRISLREEIYPH